MPPAPRPLRERFAAKFQPADGCWLWLGAVDGNGYGRIWDNDEGKKVAAHRVSWELHNGRKVPAGLVVMHSCDNPQCVNPAHLSAGTQADNVRDCTKKGRNTLIQSPSLWRRGDKHWTRRDREAAREMIAERRKAEWASGRRIAIRDARGRIMGTRMVAP